VSGPAAAADNPDGEPAALAQFRELLRAGAPAAPICETLNFHLNDAGYGGRVVGTLLAHSDYAAMARALGAHGERVEKPEDLPKDLPGAIDRALANAPALVDVVTSQTVVSSDATKGLGFVPEFQPLTGLGRSRAQASRYFVTGKTNEAAPAAGLARRKLSRKKAELPLLSPTNNRTWRIRRSPPSTTIRCNCLVRNPGRSRRVRSEPAFQHPLGRLRQ